MSAIQREGPPLHQRDRKSSQFSIHSENPHEELPAPTTAQVPTGTKRGNATAREMPTPLITSQLGNQLSQAAYLGGITSKVGYLKQKLEHAPTSSPGDLHPGAVDNLLAKLSEQQALIDKQKKRPSSTDNDKSSNSVTDFNAHPLGSSPVETAVDSLSITHSPAPAAADLSKADAEMTRLKQELIAAKNKIARMDQELSQTRITKHTLDQAMGPASEADVRVAGDVSEQTISNLQNAFNASTRPASGRNETWTTIEDGCSDTSEAPSLGPNTRAHGIWSNHTRTGFTFSVTPPVEQQYSDSSSTWSQETPRPWFNRRNDCSAPSQGQASHQQRTINGTPNAIDDYEKVLPDQGLRRLHSQHNRGVTNFNQHASGWGNYGAGAGPVEGISPPSTPFQAFGVFPVPIPHQPRPIGTPLSPTAAEFTANTSPVNPWNVQAPASPGQTYISPIEPLNYRRLLDRSVTCNWKYIVDKIVCNNDQQASIFLQQKLKIGTAEQKFEIVEAIIGQAYPLMVNRFGNFLVQRCFEHGTPEQVIAIANAIRGNTLNLSMDAFGCHVVQKAFDSVPEDFKAIMVHELLRRIPETVIHRYACHVWQKLFELRWSDSPPQIMKYVNESLRGMWHEVALGETGSLVVQNIFENCLEEDKRSCINEVLASIDNIAHGQFGNWCIQHICEHGLPSDRSRAVEHVLRYATEYSMDQFASKVVEKCLKIGGPDFLERYLERVCEGRPDRPRIPLIDSK
ncbi:MAG: hypothetical protein M1819_005137 [Sarea resinae]|nr:MAG: hypothetical protein M1819_005137 [Sarea resinae]